MAMRGVLFGLLFATNACYTYSHVETAATETTAIARVELTEAGSIALTQALGESVQIVEGPVLDNSGGTLQIDVHSLRRRGETLMKEWPSDHVSIPASNIRDVSLRTIDRKRSTFAVIGGTVAAVVIVALVAKGTSIFTGGNGKVIMGNVR